MSLGRDLGIVVGVAGAAGLIGKLLKPDGTDANSSASPISIPKGLADRITGLTEAKATDAIKDGASTVATDNTQTQAKSGTSLGNIVPNPLEEFASYTCLWTMACLTKEQFNNPSTYRADAAQLQNIVFASAGRYDSQRAETKYGSPEYFVNNFKMQHTLAANVKTGTSNVIGFQFDVFEPYSMGTLLQSLQSAALAAGYPNYLGDTPYVLKLDIQGFDEVGKVFSTIKPKYFPLKLSTCKFTVNEGGSNYKITAIPFNHGAYADQMNIAYTDVTLSGAPNGPGTVKDLLVSGDGSLVNYLNNREQEAVTQGRKGLADVYVIQFPENAWDYDPGSTGSASTPMATLNPLIQGFTKSIGKAAALAESNGSTNEIGSSSLGFSQTSGGNQPFKRDADVRDEKTGVPDRDKVSIDSANRTFQFHQNQKITDIIEQVIKSSDYAVKAMKPENITAEGMIKWFKIDAQFQLIEQDPKTQLLAKKIIYRVVPFLVHQSVFSPVASAPPGYAAMEKKLVKKYEYIYTGQNVSIIKFDININNMFMKGINAGSESQTGMAINAANGGTAENPQLSTETNSGSNSAAVAGNLGNPPLMPDPKQALTQIKGGSGTSSSAQMLAQAFHNAFLNNFAELVSVNLEIMGDTYWIIDDGICNYFSPADGSSDLMTQDGTANFGGTDIYIYVGWRSPVDVNTGSGLYDFADNGESDFSGIYKVNACESVYESGKFIQKLTANRMPMQASDFDNQAQPIGKELAAKIDAPVPVATSPSSPAPPPDAPPAAPSAPNIVTAAESAAVQLNSIVQSKISDLQSAAAGLSANISNAASGLSGALSKATSGLGGLTSSLGGITSGLSSAASSVTSNASAAISSLTKALKF